MRLTLLHASIMLWICNMLHGIMAEHNEWVRHQVIVLHKSWAVTQVLAGQVSKFIRYQVVGSLNTIKIAHFIDHQASREIFIWSLPSNFWYIWHYKDIKH